MPGSGGNSRSDGDGVPVAVDRDEDLTPSDGFSIQPRSLEARLLANFAGHLATAAARVWDGARIYDQVDGDRRDAFLAQLTAEIAELRAAADVCRDGLRAMKEGR